MIQIVRSDNKYTTSRTSLPSTSSVRSALMNPCKFLPNLVQVNAWVGLKIALVRRDEMKLEDHCMFRFCFKIVSSCANQSHFEWKVAYTAVLPLILVIVFDLK